jgi:hypothetical protein
MCPPPSDNLRYVSLARGREHRTHPVAGVVEDLAVVFLGRLAQHLIVSLQSGPHRIGVGLPPPRRALDICEQERDDP